MRAPDARWSHRTRFGLAASGLALTLVVTACEVIPVPAVPQPRLGLNNNSSTAASGSNQVSVAGVQTANGTAPTLTYTVKRTTLDQGLSISGTVVPARSAQLSLHGGGTVTAVHVKSGDSVKQGDPLIEFALDDESLHNAQTQATLAELAAESEETKLAGLTSVANDASVAQLQATIQADQANIQRLQDQQVASQVAQQRAADQATQARTKAQAAADREVTRAQIALAAANDELTSARAAQARVKPAQVKVKAEAQAAVDSAARAVRNAQRRVDQGNIQLSQAKLNWAGTRANQDLAMRQLAFDQDTAQLNDAKDALAAAQDQSPSTQHPAAAIAREVATATNAVRSAERILARDTLALNQAKAIQPAVNSTDDAAIQSATLSLAQANDDLAQAKAVQQRAQEKLDALNKSPSSDDFAGAANPAEADAAVRQAQHKVDAATITLLEAQAAQSIAQDAVDAASSSDGSNASDTATQPAVSQQSLSAANAQLKADQAKLAALQSPASASDIKREQVRASLLREQADAATAAAAPVVVLSAPFDGTVTEIGVTLGQTIVSGQSSGAVSTQSAAQSSSGAAKQVPAIQLEAAGPSSILASASETDVSSFQIGQPVNIDFTGLPGRGATGTISDISGAATIGKNGAVVYPVKINVDQMPPAVKLGMTAQIGVTLDQAANALVVPRDALRQVDEQWVVSKIDGNQVADVPVQIGRTFGSQVELLAGVDEGDKLAIYSSPTAPSKP